MNGLHVMSFPYIEGIYFNYWMEIKDGISRLRATDYTYGMPIIKLTFDPESQLTKMHYSPLKT